MAPYLVFIRIAFGFVGLFSIAWSVGVLEIFRQQSSIQSLAASIVDGVPFKVDTLKEQTLGTATVHSAYCDPVGFRSAAIIRLRVVEEAGALTTGVTRHELTDLDNSVRSALSCSPADPFLWLVIYWIGDIQTGFRSEYLNYLRMSYRLGPNEGWIGVRRNRLAFAEFDRLPPDLVEAAMNEFVSLLEAGLYEATAEIFIDQGWPARQRLLSKLENVPERHRQIFARNLIAHGYDGVIPGIERRDIRPWH